MSLSDPRFFGLLAVLFFFFHLLRPGLPRRVLLLAASYFFYFELSRYYIVVLLLVTAGVYWGAFLLRSQAGTRHGSLLFGLICALVLTPMIVFKYLGAFLGFAAGGTFPILTPLEAGLASLAAPVGISFFTIAALGYLIDVYLEVLDPEPRFFHVALFLAFFPLISAGPIERAGRFMPQLDLEQRFSADRAFSALRLILIGLVMKVYLADRLSGPVDQIFAMPAACSPLALFGGPIFYAFYLYADFGGYSLIAIGSAKLFGLDVRPNFLQPFLSTSVPEFWRNWHISLSSWVRDYLFTPLRMEWRRHRDLGMAGALIISFAILGVWHGAKWGYFAFGLAHGLICTASAFTLTRRNAFWSATRIPPFAVRVWRILVTFLLVSLAFVFFRANTIHDALVIYRGIFSPQLLQEAFGLFRWLALHKGNAPTPLMISLLKASPLIAVIVVGDIMARCKVTMEKFPALVQIGAYNVALLIIILNWLVGHGAEHFVYYQF